MASRSRLHNDLRPNETSPKIAQEQIIMTIRYSNGYTVEAILLTHTQESMRVEIQGGDDVAEFREINGRWVSEDCEPVEMEFAWTRRADAPVVTVDDCICSQELAARLLDMLFSGESDPETIAAMNRVSAIASAPVYHHVVL